MPHDFRPIKVSKLEIWNVCSLIMLALYGFMEINNIKLNGTVIFLAEITLLHLFAFQIVSVIQN